MGSNNLLNDPGKKSARINEDDVKNAEQVGMDDLSASTAMSRLLEKAVELQNLKEKLREEIDSEKEEIERRERRYNL